MTLPKIVRDVSLIFLVIFAIFFLFFLQTILETADFTSEDQATGEVIRIGNTIIVNTTEEPKQPPPNTLPSEPLSKNLQCWKNGGITAADLAIVGNLLEGTVCEESPARKPVSVTAADSCLHIAVGDDAQTDFCMDEATTPTLHLELPTGGEGTVIPPSTKRNYLPAILFLLILFLTFGFWSWNELRAPFFRKERLHPYDALELQYGKHRAPVYAQDNLPNTAEAETFEKQYLKLLHEQQQQPTAAHLTKKEILTSLQRFRQLTETLSVALKKNDIVTARRTYDALLTVFFPLYRTAPDEQKKMLLQTTLYFDKQLALLKKSGKISHLIKTAYRDMSRSL